MKARTQATGACEKVEDGDRVSFRHVFSLAGAASEPAQRTPEQTTF